MPELPHDVWMQIAGLLTVDHLLTLVAVNRSFYDIVLDMRYREIHWVRLDKDMLRTLVCLQHPLTAKRVRRLHIRAWFVQYLANSSAASNDASPQDALKHWTSNRLSTISKHLTTVKKTFSPPRTSTYNGVSSLEHRLRRTLSRSAHAALKSPSSIVPMMVAAFQCMTNLTEYDFEWRDLPLNTTTRSFIPSSAATLSSLRKLVLHAQLPQLKDILSQVMLELSGLQDLELYFDYTPPSTTTVATPSDIAQASILKDTILTTIIAPFIASLRPSLSSLTITSAVDGDHSCLFNSLGPDPFPHLHAFAIRIPFDNDHLCDTDGLMRLLQINAGTLLHVELRPTGSGEIALEDGGPWSRMSQASLSPTFLMTFTHLESLTIPVQDLQSTLKLIKRSAGTVKSLCLLGKLLREDEVREIVKLFNEAYGGKLKKLDICVQGLKPGILGLLAAGLPALRALGLVLEKDFVMWTFTPGTTPQYDWGLDDLSIYLGRSRGAVEAVPVADMTENNMMVEMQKSIPSVKSFKQWGLTVNSFESRW